MVDTENEDYCVFCKYVENWENQSIDNVLSIVKKKELLIYARFLL